VSDDKTLMIWDKRCESPSQIVEAHVAEIMCVDYSPFDQHLLLTGSDDKTVAVWDTRNLNQKLCSLRAHKDDVSQAKFSR